MNHVVVFLTHIIGRKGNLFSLLIFFILCIKHWKALTSNLKTKCWLCTKKSSSTIQGYNLTRGVIYVLALCSIQLCCLIYRQCRWWWTWIPQGWQEWPMIITCITTARGWTWAVAMITGPVVWAMIWAMVCTCQWMVLMNVAMGWL